MSDNGIDIDARIRDRLEALARALTDPNLSLELKVEEFHSAHARVCFLEDARPLAESLNVLAALAATSKGK